MQFFQLEYAIKVAELKSFSLAARELYISQPSLSQQILRLEKEFGIKIFYRNAKGIQLTEAGKTFIDYARRLLAGRNELNKSMQAYASIQKGVIKIGMFYTCGYLHLFDDIAAFKKQHPTIEVNIIIESSSSLHRMLLNGEIDIGIFIASPNMLNSDQLAFSELEENHFAAAIPLDNPLSTYDSVRFEDLYDQNLLLPPASSTVRRILMENTPPNHRWRIVGESSPTEACLQMVNSGLGIGITSVKTANAVNIGKYRVVPLIPDIKQLIYVVMQKHLLEAPLLKALYTFIESQHNID